MRNTLILLSSLALAAAASAQSTATSTSTTSATYTAPASVVLQGFTNNQFGYGYDFDDANGTTTLGHAESTSFSHAGNTFTVGSQTSASLDAPNYGTVAGLAYADSYLGQRYVLTFKNTGAVAQTLTFDMAVTHGTAISAASPVGRANVAPDYFPDRPGAVAEEFLYGGVGDFTDPNNEVIADVYNTIYTSTIIPSFSFTIPDVYRAEFRIGAGETRTYRVFANCDSFVAFRPAPVPEPATLAALGAGAFALLRRRRKA